jgi:DNA-binding transcriptional regulator LsrR (DeoR family)
MADEERSEPSHVMTRAEIAYEMKVQGKSLSEISQEMDITATHVSRLISDQMRGEAELLSMEDKHTLLALENARLERLINVHWESAMYGDLKAGEFLLKTIALHAKLNQLDIPDAAYNQNTVLVIGGEAADYVERLKSLSA